MNPSSKSIQTILVEALEIEDAHCREAFLARACEGNSELYQEVATLMQAHAAAKWFLPDHRKPREQEDGSDVKLAGARARGPIPEQPGDRIGHYKLLQAIGEGGCGVVYMADQDYPVRRRVALKLL